MNGSSIIRLALRCEGEHKDELVKEVVAAVTKGFSAHFDPFTIIIHFITVYHSRHHGREAAAGLVTHSLFYPIR